MSAHDRKTDKLLSLAEDRFGKLSATEVKFFSAIASGKVASFETDNNTENNPAEANNWGSERVIPSDRLVWLCREREISEIVTNHGIIVSGARIVGEVELDFARIPFPLIFSSCKIDSVLYFRHANIAAMYFTGTHCVGVVADGLVVNGGFSFRSRSKCIGQIRLHSATILGNLEFSDCDLYNKDGVALSAEGIKVRGSFFMVEKFRAIGQVRLVAAEINRSLMCRSGSFLNRGKIALIADGIRVDGQVALHKGFKAMGMVSIIAGNIGTNLTFEDSTILNRRGIAIGCDSVHVAGNFFFQDLAKVYGRVQLTVASIKGGFTLLSPKSVLNYSLDLRGAKVGRLWDDKSCWPESGRLYLDGFQYDSIDDEAPRDAASRINWLHLQPSGNFCPQPYEQLASVLDKQGHESDAREIRIQKNIDRAKETDTVWYKGLWNWFLSETIRYGYKPWLVWRYALAFVVLGFILFGIGADNQAISPVHDYPSPFSPLGYSLDEFLPIIDLHYGSNWAPNSATAYGCFLIYYLWLHIVSGWVLASLLVASLTGIIKK